MKILGINLGHDSSVCLIDNGRIRYAIEEEKVSRIKQDFGWPVFALERLFLEHDIKPEDVDVISFDAEIPRMIGKDEIAFRFSKSSYDKNLEYINRITSYLKITKRKIVEHRNQEEIASLLKERGFAKAAIKYFGH